MVVNSKIFIIVEDFYAVKFIENLCKKLDFREKIKIRSFKGKSKILSRKLEKTLSEIFYPGNQKYRKAIILLDGDGNPAGTESIVLQYVKDFSSKTRVIIFNQEIEEWITESLGITERDEKPSETLDKFLKSQRSATEGYQKRHLPGYAAQLIIEKIRGLQTFTKFINALNCN